MAEENAAQGAAVEPAAASHTQTPWRVVHEDDGIWIFAGPEGDGYLICEMHGFEGSVKIDAAFIVSAVNAHDKLVKVVREFVGVCEHRYKDGSIPWPDGVALVAARDALAAAGSGVATTTEPSSANTT